MGDRLVYLGGMPTAELFAEEYLHRLRYVDRDAATPSCREVKS
jgi:hypothetical protein